MRKLDKIELHLLTELHSKQLEVPRHDNPIQRDTVCAVCGHEVPCPTLRLIEEVQDLRKMEITYSESLYEKNCRTC